MYKQPRCHPGAWLGQNCLLRQFWGAQPEPGVTKKWLSLIFLILTFPLLLAPIRYQSGPDNIILTPTRGVAEPSMALPPATPITAPVVITLSPTIAITSFTLISATISPTANPTISPTKAIKPLAITPPTMPKPLAIMCTKALQGLTEIALNSYQQQPQTALATLAMAATVGAEKAARQTYPALGTLTEMLQSLDRTTPQRTQLQSLFQSARTTCQKP